jgi:hypothetical protein
LTRTTVTIVAVTAITAIAAILSAASGSGAVGALESAGRGHVVGFVVGAAHGFLAAVDAAEKWGHVAHDVGRGVAFIKASDGITESLTHGVHVVHPLLEPLLEQVAIPKSAFVAAGAGCFAVDLLRGRRLALSE